MQSKTSCFNKTVFRKHVTRFWPVWAAYLAIWLLAMPVALLSQRDSLTDNPARALVQVQSSVLNSITAGVVLSFVFAVLMAMAVWSYLYNARSASGAGCLPVTRTAQFTSAVLAGLVPLAAANVATFALTALAELSLGALHLPSLLTWLGATLLHLLFFYGFATFCAMLTGNIIVLPAVYAVLNFTAAGAQILLDGIVKCFLYGVPELGGNWLYWFSPLVTLLRTEYRQGITAYDPARNVFVTIGWRFTGWVPAAIYAAVGALLLLAAWALLRRRRMESAGDVVAVQALKPVFRWCMGIFGALCFADMMLYVFQLTWGVTQRAIFVTTAVWLVIGAFLGWFIAEMLIRRSFRVFKGGWRGFGGWALCCVVLLVGLTATEMDVFGIERRTPAAEKIESVTVWGVGESTYLESPEAVADAIALHRSVIAAKPQQDQCDQRAFFLRKAEADVQVVDFNIIYRLNNGGQIKRSYRLPHHYNEAGDDASTLQALLNCPEAVKNRKATPFDFTEENVSYGSVSAVMSARECAAAAGYDDPADYVLCELAGYSRADAAALPDELRERTLRETLQYLRQYDVSYDYDYMQKYSGGYYDEGDIPLPEKDGMIDYDGIWLEYTLPLTKQEAWELYSECVVPDLADNALGRVWILQGSDYAAAVYTASVEIDAREPEETRMGPLPVEEYDGAEVIYPMATAATDSEVRYSGFSTVPTVDSARTNAWLEAHGLHLRTVGEVYTKVWR